MRYQIRQSQHGASMVEYGIIVTLVSATVFAVFPALKPLWAEQFGIESSSGENQATLAGDLGVYEDDAPAVAGSPATPAAPPAGGSTPATPSAPAAPPPYVPPFTVLPSGAIRFDAPAAPTITILGSAIQYGAGGPQVPVRLETIRGGVPSTIFYGTGSQVTPTSGSQLNSLPTGTQIDFRGRSYNPTSGSTLYTKTTTTSNPMIIPLKNGDYVPDKTPFSQQPAIKTFLASVIDPVTKKVTIGPNEVLYLMELGTNTTSSPAADFQDLVFKVTF